MSLSCTTSPTATLYSNQLSFVTQTEYQTRFNNGTAIVNSRVETSTETQAIPTQTLYGNVCRTMVVANQGGSRTTVAESDATTSTSAGAMSTATLVSASTRGQGGGVVLVTSFSTISATSVVVVVKTASPSSGTASNATSTSSSSSSSSSSSHAGPIAGGIVAAVVLLALAGGLAWFFRKRSRRDRDTRALDDFFKDALNPGDGIGGAAAAAGGGAAASSKRNTMRRKSSLVLDLEKEKNLSHSNDEDNWAALTRMSSLGEDDNGEAYGRRSQSRQSLNAVSRAVSMRSNTPEAAFLSAMAWDGKVERSPVEEPESILNRTSSGKSSTSILKSPHSASLQLSPMMMPYDVNRPSRVRHLSSHSSDLLPNISPGLYSLPNSPDSPYANLLPGGGVEDAAPASAPNTLGRQAYDRMNSHNSISGVYLPALLPSALPKPRSFSSSSQQMPERPKSAMGLMAISNQQYPFQQQQHPQQWSPPPMNPRLHPVTGNRIQARASVHGYGNYGPYTNWSPPLAPHRMTSSSSHRNSRPPISSNISGEYPPSRYSHLDMVKPISHLETEEEGQATSATAATTTTATTTNTANEGGRQRSLSGGLLLKATAVVPESGRGEKTTTVIASNSAATSVSPSSSASNSKKNSLSIRNAASEQSTEEEEEESKEQNPVNAPSSMQAYHEKMASDVSEKAQAILNKNGDAEKRSSFWYPQGWMTKAS